MRPLRGSPQLVLLLGVAACRPDLDYAPRAAPTREVCGWAASTPGVETLDPTLPLTYPSEACVDAVLADFSVDTDAFLAADGLDDPYGYVRGDGSMAASRLSFVLGTARALLQLDYGPVADVDADDLTTHAYARTVAEVARETGDDDLGAALYDFAATVIEGVVPLDEDGGRASFEGETRTVVVRDGLDGGWAPGVVIVHEARHWWGGHRACRDGGGTCDPDASLAHGFGMSSMVRLYERLPDDADPSWRAYLLDRIHTQLRHIETYRDADGELAEEWEAWD